MLPEKEARCRDPRGRTAAAARSSDPAVVGHDRLVAEHCSRADCRVPPDVTVPAEDGIPNGRITPNPVVRPQDGAPDHRVLFDAALLPDDRMGPDSGPASHDGPLVDEAGALERGTVLDPRIGRQPACPRSRTREWRRGEAVVHDVEMNLSVVVRRADVDPVPGMDVGDKGLASLD